MAQPSATIVRFKKITPLKDGDGQDQHL